LRYEQLTRVLLVRNEQITPAPPKDLFLPPTCKLQQKLVTESEIALFVQNDGDQMNGFQQLAKPSFGFLQRLFRESSPVISREWQAKRLRKTRLYNRSLKSDREFLALSFAEETRPRHR
jgi:hypothetical protein